MTQVLLNFEYEMDIISVPNDVANNIKLYQYDFEQWLKNPFNHDYFINNTLSFDSQAFVDYLNDYVIKSNEKATLVDKDIQISFEKARSYPTINFE